MAEAVRKLASELISENFSVISDTLHIGGMSVEDLARRFGTPLFLYDAGILRARLAELRSALGGFADIFYSVKANPNQEILRCFVQEGTGLEIASGAEYLRARAAGCPSERIFFAGPAKSDAELQLVLAEGIGEIHVESFEEIERLDILARMAGRRAHIGLRINPEASTQGGAMRMGGRAAPFGFDEETLPEVLEAIGKRSSLLLQGLHLYSGTQILDAGTLAKQWRHGLDVARRVVASLGRPLQTLDLGGGLGIPYFSNDRALCLETLKDHVAQLRHEVAQSSELTGMSIVIEPGRYLIGPAGIYVCSVQSWKISRGTTFVVTDGGMHHHLAASGNLGQFVKRDYPITSAANLSASELTQCSVVGPLCTPLDTLGRDVALPKMRRGDLVVVLQSGAYALSASPTGFLSHPTPAEVMLDQGAAREIRSPGTFSQPLSQLPLG